MDKPAHRRRSLLSSLWFCEASTAGVHRLAREMEMVHNLPCSADLVRGDLTWLAEQGLVQVNGDIARSTERGADVVRGAAPWPGE